MPKEKYERTELEVIEFETKDVILTSGVNPDDEYEGERVMIHLNSFRISYNTPSRSKPSRISLKKPRSMLKCQS